MQHTLVLTVGQDKSLIELLSRKQFRSLHNIAYKRSHIGVKERKCRERYNCRTVGILVLLIF